MGWGFGDDIKVALGMGTGKNYKHVKKVIKRAQFTLEMARQNPDFLAQVETFKRETNNLDGKFKKILSALNAAEKVYQSAEDAKKVKTALGLLKGGNLISDDPQAAAKAIGDLLVGVGGLAKNLPKPGNTAGVVLVKSGSKLASIYNVIDPYSHSKGAQLKYAGEIDENMRL